MLNRKGFTLIELLAVIILLSVIALIVVPLFYKSLTSARVTAFENDARLIYKSALNYYSERDLNSDIKLPLLVTYNGGKDTNQVINSDGTKSVAKVGLESTGILPTSGQVFIDTDGTVTMKVYHGNTNTCLEKTASSDELVKVDVSKANCTLGK